jgi:hypothetical protein
MEIKLWDMFLQQANSGFSIWSPYKETLKISDSNLGLRKKKKDKKYKKKKKKKSIKNTS